MNYHIREMRQTEYVLLENFIYEAIYQPDETKLLPRSVIQEPDIQVYIQDFGQGRDDYCLCAEVEGEVIGAVWVRTVNGHGHIDDTTPEFAISLYKEFRGRGIGTEMMIKMLEHLREEGYEKAALSVQRENYALKLYEKIGFQIAEEKDKGYIMVYIF